MKYTLDERMERARALRREGYNCAQCVVMAFDDVVSKDEVAVVERAARGFGSGYAVRGLVCGAVSGLDMVYGLVSSEPRPMLYRQVGEMIDEFSALEGGVNCADLKKPGRKPCVDLITDAVAILHRRLSHSDE